MSKFNTIAFAPIALATFIILQAPLIKAQSTAKANPLSTILVATDFQKLDQICSGYYKADQPGATVIVVKDGQTLLRKAYGLANVANKESLQAEHVMRFGSITKQFTAVAILQLVEEHKIALNDTLSKFFPDYPEMGKSVTVEHLLTHSSGIPSYTEKPGFEAKMLADISVSDMLDSIKNDPLEFEPGTNFKYNNSGYFILGAIIEKVSHENYANYMARHIFTPLGLNNTAYEGHERSMQVRAQGYSQPEGGFVPSVKISMTQPYAAGSITSTVDDMAKWDAAITAGKLLKENSWKRAFTSYKLKNGQDTNYGYGWAIGQFEGKTLISHGGGIPGFSTFALRLPQDKVYVAVLNNADSGLPQPEMIAARLAASVIGKSIPEFKVVKVDEKVLDQYAGVYHIDDKNRRLFVREGNKLVMSRTNGPTTELQAYSENGFFKDSNSLLRVEFKRNANCEVSEVVVYQIGSSVSHAKLNESLPNTPMAIAMTAEQFAPLAGDYQIQTNFILNVRREGNAYVAQATGQGPVVITPISIDTFSAPIIGGQLKFEKDADGKVRQLILTQGGSDMTAKKIK